MGRLLNGPNGPFVGKAGSYIGYVVNGVGYIKGNYKPRTKPPTEKEALNREKFAVAQAWLAPLKVFLRAGFRGYSERSQGFVAAKSWLMKNAVQVINNEIIIDAALAKISSGNLPLPENIECTLQEPNTFRITWTPRRFFSHEYDQIMVAVYNITNGNVFGLVHGNSITAGEQLITFTKVDGCTYHVYVAFVAGDRSRQSDSVYMGKFEF